MLIGATLQNQILTMPLMKKKNGVSVATNKKNQII